MTGSASTPLASNRHVHPFLVEHNACREAQEWAAAYPDLAAAWAACERGDWLLWLAGRVPTFPRATLVLAACACAREALGHVKAGDDRPRLAIETAEAWARGGEGAPGLTEVRAAADAAAAAAAAYTTYTTYAAYAAAAYTTHTTYAAYAADAAAAAAYAAADADAAAAAYAAADADAAAAAAATCKASLRKSAELVRDVISWASVAELLLATC